MVKRISNADILAAALKDSDFCQEWDKHGSGDVAILVHQLRKEKGLSLTDFGKLVGFGRVVIWGWESGSGNPRFDNLKQVAQRCGYKIRLTLEKMSAEPPDASRE